jgi:hypothetical protein
MTDLHKLPFVIHGSEDSVDRDVIYLIEEMPKNKQLVHEFVNEDTQKENRNLAVIDYNEGIIVDCYKGTPDAINNQIIDTFHLHKQIMEECPVRIRITRNVPLKVTRSIRQLIGFVAQVLHHLPVDSHIYGKYHNPIKIALKSKNFTSRLECLGSIDFIEVFEDNIDIKIFKSLAFQFAQTKAMLENDLELYSKKTVAQYDTRLEPVMYRREEVVSSALDFYLSIFNEYRDYLVQHLSDVQVVQENELNLLYSPQDYIQKSEFYAQCKDGIILDMGRERLVYYPPCATDEEAVGIFLDMKENLRYTKKFKIINGEKTYGAKFNTIKNLEELKECMKSYFYSFDEKTLAPTMRRHKLTFAIETI